MAEELFEVLARFHREIVVPDIERIVENAIDGHVSPLRRDMLDGFDHLYAQLNRLESEYQALKAAVQRLEKKSELVDGRLSAIEHKLDRMALRTELELLKERVAELEQRLTQLEIDL